MEPTGSMKTQVLFQFSNLYESFKYESLSWLQEIILLSLLLTQALIIGKCCDKYKKIQAKRRLFELFKTQYFKNCGAETEQQMREKFEQYIQEENFKIEFWRLKTAVQLKCTEQEWQNLKYQKRRADYRDLEQNSLTHLEKIELAEDKKYKQEQPKEDNDIEKCNLFRQSENSEVHFPQIDN